MSQRIVILGGGFAGLFAARQIKRKLGAAAEVQLISEENYFVFQPLLPEVAAGSITAPHAVTPLRALLKDVFVRKARVHSVDFDRRIVTVFQGVQRRPTEVTYDHLVVALGQIVDLSKMPGLSDHALTIKNLEDARNLRNHVIEKLEHAEITGLPQVKREALTFTVVGAGFSGVETVGELKELIDRSLTFYPNISPKDVQVVVVEYADRVLGELPASLGQYAQEQLEARGIEIMLGRGVASATGTQLTLTDGTKIPTRTIVATIGNGPSPVVRSMGLEQQAGKIAVERTLQAKGHSNVWSIGDCALIPMKDGATERDDYAPPTAQFAVREARCLADNIAAALGQKDLIPFAYKSQGAMASLGARRGVAEVWGMKLSGFPAWLLWRAYYVGFMPGLSTKVRVMLNWIMDALAARSVVQLKGNTPPATRYVHYSAGDRIYEVGNRADGVYTIVSGAVELSHVTADGREMTAHLGEGDHFGEGILRGQDRRRSTVRALEDTKVLLMEKDVFLRMLDAYPILKDHVNDHLPALFAYGVNFIKR
ncbi:MAG: FAD-dependent oxidoreductase, partial [Pseudomonadota bacterium]